MDRTPMARTPMLRTGAFARAASLSVKALRLYHDMGLLVPSVVDPGTRYRAYSPAQLTDAAIIRLLREVGVPLQDIGAVLDARDLGLVRKVLAEQAARYQAGIDAVARLVEDLRLDGDGDGSDGDAVVIRHEAPRLVLALDGAPRLAELEGAMVRGATTLADAATASGAVVTGPFGACFPPAVEDDRQEVTMLLPVAAPVRLGPEHTGAGVRVDELAGCDAAVVEHRGPYEGLESCYRRLGTWVAFNAVPAAHAVREWYLTPIDGAQDEAVTELLWPVLLDDGDGTKA